LRKSYSGIVNKANIFFESEHSSPAPQELLFGFPCFCDYQVYSLPQFVAGYLRGIILMLTHFPTLKRGANDGCASGAKKIGARLVSKTNSCDCPVSLMDARYTQCGLCYTSS
jgi:hypothetical protein